MEPEEAVNHTTSDNNLSSSEREFSIGFTKECEKATVYSNIRSQIDRLLTHSDVDCRELVIMDDDGDCERMTLENFSGEGDIVSFFGYVPIESLKIGSNPRSTRSYADIISKQQDFVLGGED